ncbi:MAG: hypothetical protein QM778_22820 [Myxococcales bacterium]
MTSLDPEPVGSVPTPCLCGRTFAPLQASWGRELCTDCVARAPDVLSRAVTPPSLWAGMWSLLPKVAAGPCPSWSAWRA